MSLFHSLGIGAEALFVNRQGLDTTAHNIANAQTEGYSRQRVDLYQREPLVRQGLIIGDGTYVGVISRAHDKHVEKQVNLAASDAGFSKTRNDALLDLESIYNTQTGASLAEELNQFFAAVSELSRNPEELSVRTAVKEQGENLAAAFRRIDSELRRFKEGINEKVKISSYETNQILTNISHLNSQIAEKEVGPRNKANDLRDQRDLLLNKLSERMAINYYEDKDGMLTIHGPADTLLVDRNKAASISLSKNLENQGLYDVVIRDFENSGSRNVTHLLKEGTLASLIDVRDRVGEGLMANNNEMASTLVNQFNAIHRDGFGLGDYSGKNGRNFFKTVGDIRFAAQNINLDDSIVNSTDSIATSSLANTPGDNIIVNRLRALDSTKIFGDGKATLTEYYADYVGILGMESLRTKNLMDSDDIILSDLRSRREAISGVSLDEEAANLIRWQTAFTASSKVITTVDEMLETVLNLKR